MGLENGLMADQQFTASSVHDEYKLSYRKYSEAKPGNTYENL
jgi:hypothetical protein